VFGAAGAACSWSVLRQLKSNPDVHLTKAHRMNGAGEDPTTLKRAQEYAHSIFRRAHAMRKGPGDVSGLKKGIRSMRVQANAGGGQGLWPSEAQAGLSLVVGPSGACWCSQSGIVNCRQSHPGGRAAQNLLNCAGLPAASDGAVLLACFPAGSG
jgi:hypothetical protein